MDSSVGNKSGKLSKSQPVTLTPHPETSNSYPATRNPKPGTRNSQPDLCYAVDLNLIDYREAWQLQSDLVSARVNKTIDTDIILFLEHPAVFTLGRRGGLDHLLVSETFLQKSGIPIIHVERGGDITFHAPGQLVVYPIMNLETRRISVVDFVGTLEEVMLRTAASWGIAAERNSANRGIWVDDKKLGSIGISLRKGVSFHGLALNVNMDLTPFSWIQPCGLQGVCMTSMTEELGRDVIMDEVRNAVRHHFESVFQLHFEARTQSELQRRLKILV
jgi:lipoate-protein ligase B